ncbi:molybdate ABC transporter substrate-binding prot ein [Desulfonema ishimotonii]|uniref:Molybdate ABC transporter substrate-binding prot ein n=1 Tax=Desulfonema ishimotonii TaxID=45657 RepID=A0A401FR58_9BACT|nr:molybdate ABC transporter substrate-binding protein [Desulfonema ishimotonii]GBC59444.1 molybdate ABC transporter substrate-binding prot ein [Desulfonema ishimotonii]
MKHRQNMVKILNAFLILALCAALLPSAWADDTQKVTVFAAASTTNAITDIGKLFTEKKMGQFTPSFASSSTLAKQIDHGAPADVYLSANPKWMDFLEKKDMIEKGTRTDLLGNRIVLIAPPDGKLNITIKAGFDLAGILGDEKLAMGDPDHVPAGIYGKQALESLGVWAAVAPKVARSKDVRAALALVERGEAPLGIVYATDAAISEKVKVVAIFPEDSHPAITYPVALIAGKTTPAAKAFLEFLRTPDAKAVFETYGFSVR